MEGPSSPTGAGSRVDPALPGESSLSGAGGNAAGGARRMSLERPCRRGWYSGRRLKGRAATGIDAAQTRQTESDMPFDATVAAAPCAPAC